jgi:hypothetical protein
VNVAAQHPKDNLDQWQALAQAALSCATGGAAAGQIASYVLSLMTQKKLDFVVT